MNHGFQGYSSLHALHALSVLGFLDQHNDAMKICGEEVDGFHSPEP